LIIVVDGRRRNVVRAPPQHELLFTEFFEGGRLVLTLQRAVVALIQTPRTLGLDPEPISDVE
jgi:hypothetical protein